LLAKHGKFGSFFACPDKECKFTANVGDDGKPKEKEPAKPKEYMSFPCKNCGAKMIKRTGKFGEFAGCEKYPTCKTMSDLEGKFKEPSKKKWNKWKKKT
jgi:DNA topoisomerase-1